MTESKGSLLADQPDMEEFFAMLDESGYDNLVHVHSKSYTIQCNYKVFMDNYLDGGYHVPVAHPGLSGSLDMSSYTRRGAENFYLQQCDSVSGGGGGAGSAERVGDGSAPALYIFHYPNLMVNRYGKWMDTNIAWPLSPTSCRVDFDWFVTPDLAADRAYIEKCIQDSEQVQDEDIWLCERVQKGLQSPVFDSGWPCFARSRDMFDRLMPLGRYRIHINTYIIVPFCNPAVS